MATAVPKSTEKASVDLFEGLQTSSLNLPIAPSHPILLTSTSETSPFLGKNELVQVENDKANHEKKAKLTINDSNNAGFAKLSKLYTSEVRENLL